MNECHAAALSNLIVDHIRLARSRCETLGWLIASILTTGTVTLTRLAAYIDSRAQIASVHRRLERFFRDVRLNEADVARLVVAALSLAAKPWHLAIDRTNWQFGKTDLNLLVLSVAHGDVCIPLFCRVLDKAGNSHTAERIDLMQVFKATFPAQPVASLTGDREFIGNAWIEWLQQAAIPHFLRLREDMQVFNDSHAPLPLRQHGARLRTGERRVLKGCWRIGGSERNASPPVRIVILRLKTGELLIIASRSRPQHALNIYRQRWKIDIDQAWQLSRIKRWVGLTCNEAFRAEHRGSNFSSVQIRAADRQAIAGQRGRATPAWRRGVRRARCRRDCRASFRATPDIRQGSSRAC
jgi:hypothetical protein